MTTKEAIMILESIQPSCGEKYSFSESERYEAIDMAIKALEAQDAVMLHVDIKETSAEDVSKMLKEMNNQPILVSKSNNSEIPNSSDCIDRAEAQTAIQFAARRYTVAHEAHGEGYVVWSDNLISVTDAMNALREVPSTHPEPKTGEWIKISPARIYECSKCGKNVMTNDIEAYNFCHGCGADMRGKQDE